VAAVDSLKRKIHEVRFPFLVREQHELENSEFTGKRGQSQIKPSGKIKFMSAYRFFRKEMVPVIKKHEPLLDSNGRHQVVHNLWTQL
jgi:hypothetical protein